MATPVVLQGNQIKNFPLCKVNVADLTGAPSVCRGCSKCHFPLLLSDSSLHSLGSPAACNLHVTWPGTDCSSQLSWGFLGPGLSWRGSHSASGSTETCE